MSAWRLVPTPNPSELSIVITVPQQQVSLQPNAIPLIGATLNTLAWIPDGDVATDDRYGLYVFMLSGVRADREGIVVDFYYAKNKTPDERNTPFITYTVTEKVVWYPVLEWIQFGQETGFPLSQNIITPNQQQGLVLAPRWLVKRGYRPGLTLTTKVQIKKFLSEVPWPDWAMESDEPQPTEVSWDLVGSHGNMGRCLHPSVPVPGQSSGYKVISQAGDLYASSSTDSNGQLYPRTNHIRWQDYIVNEVDQVEGQYLRIEKTYFAPIAPKITKEAS